MGWLIKKLKGPIRSAIINKMACERQRYVETVQKILHAGHVFVDDDMLTKIYDATETWIISIIDNL